jgi:gamma-tubulin complex component 4
MIVILYYTFGATILLSSELYLYIYVPSPSLLCISYASHVTDVNVALRQAMIKIAMEHEELTKQFQLTVITPATELGKAPAISRRKMSAWKYIGMVHTVSWPLHVVFTPAALEKYSSLFQFLLSLRRAQIALQQSWAILMTLRAHTHSLQPVWQLRTHMGFLIDNLQYYVQVDVLEAQYSLLVEKIKSTHDFETIKNSHSEFLSTLQSQLFYSLDPVS